MAPDISEAVLEGDAYERATALTRRVFPMSLTSKIRLCVLVLASTGLLAPAIAHRQALIAELDPAGGTTPPALVTVVALGSGVTFLFGLAFLRQRHVVRARELDFETAKQLVRFEDVLMTFAVSTGLLFVLVPLSLAVMGAVSSDAVVYLYQRDIRLYRPSGGSLATTVRVSAGGLVLGAALLVGEIATR